MRLVPFLIIIVALNVKTQAQKTSLRIGLDPGIKHYDIIEELVNSNKYEGTVVSALNPTLYWITEKKISFLRLSYSSLSLQTDIANSNFSADLSDVAILYNHIHTIQKWGNVSMFIGGTVETHLKVYSQSYRGINRLDVFESSLVNLNLSLGLRLNLDSWDVYFLPDVGLLNFWTKAIPAGTSTSDYTFQTDFANSFTDFQVRIFAIHKLSERWELKPEYSISYYNYNYQKAHMSRVLQQGWFVGFYYLL